MLRHAGLRLQAGRRRAAANYGELIPPRPLSGRPSTALRGKWLLIAVDGAACDAWCEKKLYYLRQLRRAQGKDMDRVERLWLLTDDGKPRAELLPAIEGTVIERAPKMDAFPGNPPIISTWSIRSAT